MGLEVGFGVGGGVFVTVGAFEHWSKGFHDMELQHISTVEKGTSHGSLKPPQGAGPSQS